MLLTDRSMTQLALAGDARMKIAVVGAGISGLSSAYRLSQAGHEVSLYEANDYFGGHTHTVDISTGSAPFGVDTGFLVFNHKTYPNLVKLFRELDIETVSTDMSFSVKMPLAGRTLEWAGASLDTVFAQRRNLLSRPFYRMLRDIVRFNRQTTVMAESGVDADSSVALGDFLAKYQYSNEFRDWYLLPMAGCIWSCPTAQMLAFPVSTFVQFCHNHGLLQVNDRPQWHTVAGGARQYVDKMLGAIAHKYLSTPVTAVTRVMRGDACAVRIQTPQGSALFDHVVLASHSDQSLAMLHDASALERELLSAVKYQRNLAVLHTDEAVLPVNRKAWSAWNYQSENGYEPRVCVHYLINMLQPLPTQVPVIVTLNPITELDASKVIERYDYSHPVFDSAAIAAQQRLPLIQGERNTWFAGAWTGYGFHEDGLKSGLAVAQAISQPSTRALELAAAA